MKRKTGTREWSGSSFNIQLGCKNDCKYCYAKAMAAQSGRKKPEDWANEEINKSAVYKKYGRRSDKNQPIMFPTMHDINLDNWQWMAIHGRSHWRTSLEIFSRNSI